MQNDGLNFHNADYSVIQSAVAQIIREEGISTGSFHEQDERMHALSKTLAAMDNGDVTDVGDGIEFCMKILVEYILALRAKDYKKAQQKKNEFQYTHCDLNWLIAAAEWWAYYDLLKKQPMYVNYTNIDDFQYDLPLASSGNLKVGLVADWGTGEQVAKLVMDLLFEQQVDVILHLGDIYYAGTPTEAKNNFLQIIQDLRTKHGLQIPVYNLPGNHDYYSGGQGFYSINDELNHGIPNSSIQEASYWTLSNSDWHFQGMDTGFYDSDLENIQADITHLHSTEVAWHQDKLDKAVAAGKKIILLSHHQLFSSLLNIGSKPNEDNSNPYLEAYFGSYINNGDITAWFWGHEHLLEIYDSYLGLDKGRCVGYGAFPALYGDGKSYDPIYPQVPLDTSIQLSDNGEVYAHGFAVMDLGTSSGTVTYYSIPGDGSSSQLTEVYQEVI
ncbi:MAG: hypothetical protein CL840_02375 [Crocinitomicaceae bacterium]|nr:hypothetical protein [Crocinitomicaceae bacterium]|tara:strand:+ start:883 stop:2208 length:1326 start_codon:yes stop_codon:yes gene_type:complete